MTKTGVFLCHCGKNIAATVDIEKLKTELEKDPKLVVRDDIFICSKAGQELIKNTIKEEGLDRVVIASCSPVHHGDIFSKCIGTVLNNYMWDMANIREQCSWIHSDIEEGTEKALALIKGAINRVKLHTPIAQIKVPMVRDVMVIGAGIAGMHAALELANKDFKVILIDKEPVIGGNMARLDRTFPTDDCSMCTISPILNEVMSNDNIELHTMSEVEEFMGRPGDYRVKIRKRARYVDEEKCTGCGTCSEKCPVKLPNEYDFGLGKRKAIYTPYPQAVPNIPVLDRDNCVYFIKEKCGNCKKFCEVDAIDFEQEDQLLERNVGSVIVATGYQQYDLSNTEYNIEHPNVITGLELERMLSPAGPTVGKVICPDTNEKPESITFIQCAGSRDERHRAYCSNICCMYATKNAGLILKEHPDIEINICYIDYRAAGRSYEEYYRNLRGMGVNMIQGRPSEIQKGGNGKLTFDVYDTHTGKLLQIETDLVVLSTALVPSEGTRKMIETLHMVFGPDGFIKPVHVKIAPVDTSLGGVFVAGTSLGPKPIQDCIADAGAAASRVASFLKSDEMVIDLNKAFINTDLCITCGNCIEGCKYDAIDTTGDEYKIIEVACQGCGKCSALCPTNAIDLRHFLDEQITAQVDGILATDKDSIIAFSCTQCGYNAADIAGTSRYSYPKQVKIIRLPCTARISIEQMIYPFIKGAKGVMVMGCLEDQCHYIDGNIGAKERAHQAKKILDIIGIGGHRLEFYNLSSAEGHKFAEYARRMVESVC